MTHSAFLRLQGKVLFLIPGKIQSLCLQRDPLAGVVAEAETLVIFGFQTLFNAKDGAVFQTGAMGTIGTGTFNFFSEQHEFVSSRR